jgi:glycosyltransferase involved in cell wall biosynthesis
VVSDVPGLAEVVIPEVGAKVPAAAPYSLARAVAERLLNPGLARREGAAAARHAVRFDHRLTFDQLAFEVAGIVGVKELATW